MWKILYTGQGYVCRRLGGPSGTDDEGGEASMTIMCVCVCGDSIVCPLELV